MTTIKSYTDLEQSKTLSKILPFESADMYWDYDVQKHEYYPMIMDDQFDDTCIPCWSLAVLLIAIPKRIKGYNVLRIDISDNEFAIWYDEIGCGVNNDLPDVTMESAVDACVEMIEKLHKLNLL